MHMNFLLESVKGMPLQRWKDNISRILEKKGVRVWTEFIWLRIGISGRLL
jgi:hypothetical protein